MEQRRIISLALMISAGMANVCFASTGIYATGYGTREQGMGGVGIATGESALAPAENPAGIAFSGDRLDIGGGLFFIHGGAQDNGVSYNAKTGITPMPEFGYVKSLSPSLVFGVASWASGASMSYRAPYGGIPGNSNTYSQGVFVHIAPTIAYRFGAEKNHALALSFVGALSTIDVEGIQGQTGLPNQGRNWTPGYGFKIGWMSQFTSQLSIGAFYASKVQYMPWHKYDHIFADGGRFEEPEQYGVGIAFRPTPKWLLGFDWIRFNYAKTHVLGNPVNFSVPLGDINGCGFGFANTNAYRFGVQYELTDRITVRGGLEMTDQIVTPDSTGFTFLAPTTLRRTYTVGATYRIGKQSELSFAYAISPRVQVNGTAQSTGTNPYAQNNFVALTYTKKF
ncbi:long-chain fatty acid transport protein [Paraburkholderia sp. BL23I1N1]|uniref:OmpP1/FadL family transporter n=1 Tax=Paraburkholderia sp. BL23I1N1 TaxID=1938802 RepID=UPI000E732801|nr:outer membrane protein transport protein [Paraburkholderia sp. BL23I1N1]RKE38603.1 long-chain fatty acid transport protein [Paraburkholderia sp. BL23I1N1]